MFDSPICSNNFANFVGMCDSNMSSQSALFWVAVRINQDQQQPGLKRCSYFTCFAVAVPSMPVLLGIGVALPKTWPGPNGNCGVFPLFSNLKILGA